MVASMLGTVLSLFSNNLLQPAPRVLVPGVGRLRGTTVKSADLDRDIHGFWAIPYGAPPTGNRRFAPPLPAAPLNDGTSDYNAGQLGFLLNPRLKCAQPSRGGGVLDWINKVVGRGGEEGVAGAEDCLNLAVFTPHLRPNRLLPVMVFIHGGAFISGTYAINNPRYLLDEDVVLVNIHYRLGLLGFMCLDHPDSPGNMGLMDQVLALRWVQAHIRHFGGDPSRVTVFGESAGAMSISFLMNSAAARGLFHRAILQSGSAMSGWLENFRPRSHAANIAKIAGCADTSSDAQILRCLKYEKSAGEIVRAADLYKTQTQLQATSFGFDGVTPCRQTAGNVTIIQKFLSDDPDPVLANPVPAFMGANKDEGNLFAALVYENSLVKLGKVGDISFLRTRLIPSLLTAFNFANATNPIFVDQITRKFFLPGDLSSFSSMIPGLSALLGTFFIKDPTYSMARLNARQADTYFYSFNHASDHSLFKFLVKDVDDNPIPHGVGHGDELIFLFNLGLHRLTKVDRKVSRAMVKMWTRFARGLTPHQNLNKVNPYDDEQSQYCIIQNPLYIDRNYPKTYSALPIRGG